MRLENNWRFKSLANLNRLSKFTISANPPSHIISRCEELHLVALADFTVEDIRLMIGQGYSFNYLVPLALEKLKEDILAEGDFFPGDLLSNVLNIKPSFWKENPDLFDQLKTLVLANEELIVNEGISIKMFRVTM